MRDHGNEENLFDPTMVASRALYVRNGDRLHPMHLLSEHSAATERDFRPKGGGAPVSPVPKDLTAADYRASWGKWLPLLTRLQCWLCPSFPATDGSGSRCTANWSLPRGRSDQRRSPWPAATLPCASPYVDKKPGSIKVGSSWKGATRQREFPDFAANRVAMRTANCWTPCAAHCRRIFRPTE